MLFLEMSYVMFLPAAMKVVRHWNRLPGVMAASSLAVFKARWDGALSNLV